MSIVNLKKHSAIFYGITGRSLQGSHVHPNNNLVIPKATKLYVYVYTKMNMKIFYYHLMSFSGQEGEYGDEIQGFGRS